MLPLVRSLLVTAPCYTPTPALVVRSAKAAREVPKTHDVAFRTPCLPTEYVLASR